MSIGNRNLYKKGQKEDTFQMTTSSFEFLPYSSLSHARFFYFWGEYNFRLHQDKTTI